MQKNTGILVFFCLLLAAISCSEEIQPTFITGDWEAYYFERVDCRDSSQNIMVDLNVDSVYSLDGKQVQFSAYELSVLENGEYTFTLSKTVDGVNQVEMESGVSLSSGFNDIIFCKGPCIDTMFKPGLYVRANDRLDLSFEDTLDIGCGVVFQAFLK